MVPYRGYFLCNCCNVLDGSCHWKVSSKWPVPPVPPIRSPQLCTSADKTSWCHHFHPFTNKLSKFPIGINAKHIEKSRDIFQGWSWYKDSVKTFIKGRLFLSSWYEGRKIPAYQLFSVFDIKQKPSLLFPHVPVTLWMDSTFWAMVLWNTTQEKHVKPCRALLAESKWINVHPIFWGGD